MRNGSFGLILLGFIVFASATVQAANLEDRNLDPKELVHKAMDYWRDKSSYQVASMEIRRPDWQRKSRLKSWTKGLDYSLVRFVFPPKDFGNATLSVKKDIWTFTPKTSRVIKIPPSMKSQSWMGSDFSYRDLSKDAAIIDEYDHKLIGREEHEGKVVYVIESIPHEEAPVVWGKEVLRVREDYILLRQEFFDQEMKLVKRMVASEIKPIGGKLFATVLRMENAEEPGKWTEMVVESAEFGGSVPKQLFTLSNLRNPRK